MSNISGRLLSGGARGPGVFFIIPCVDIYEKIDMRVQNFDVPPQEVTILLCNLSTRNLMFLKHYSYYICVSVLEIRLKGIFGWRGLYAFSKAV